MSNMSKSETTESTFINILMKRFQQCIKDNIKYKTSYTYKVKVKLPLGLTKFHAMKTYPSLN